MFLFHSRVSVLGTLQAHSVCREGKTERCGGDTNSAHPPSSIPSAHAAWSEHLPELRTSTESEQELVSQKSPEAMLTIPQPSYKESYRELWKATASVKFWNSLILPSSPTSVIQQD